MGTITRFEDIISWQKARVFCQQVFIICTTTPLERDYKLRDQINGSSGSVMDNIAEGFGRGGNSEFVQFLEVSYASACESQSQLYRACDRNYITQQRFKELYEMVEEIKRLLLGFIEYLNQTPMAGPKYKNRVKKQK
jgi:four helix bundle protein